MKLSCLIVLIVVSLNSGYTQDLRSVLGIMPARPATQVDTLERHRLPNGWRYKIRYLSEESDTILHTPADYITAYLFIPQQLQAARPRPAVIAVHQDGSHNYIGAAEVAGIRGDADQHYGLELFNRGYIVICPDRFLHAGRRRIAQPDTLADVFKEADAAEQHRVGQLLMQGRNFFGKEVHDLMVTTDVLWHTPGVDTTRIAAIGHSAGGAILPYWMYMDGRIRAGASSCGVFELSKWFDEHAVMKRNLLAVVPSFLLAGRTADYVAALAPRPFLMTRGIYEWGNGDAKQLMSSQRHVADTRELDSIARKQYDQLKASHQLRTIYFDEGGGQHQFPKGVKEQVYQWLDNCLR